MSNKIMNPTSATIHQEVKDFKDTYRTDIREIKTALNDILTQARHTNGRVTTLEVKEKTCPARQNYELGNRNAKASNIINVFAILVALCSLALAYLSMKGVV